MMLAHINRLLVVSDQSVRLRVCIMPVLAMHVILMLDSWFESSTAQQAEQCTDEALIRLYMQGKEQAGEELYTRYVRKIYDYLYFKVYNEKIAQDICSQTWLAVFSKIDQFDPEVGSGFRARLYRIAYNKLMDHRREHYLHNGELQQIDEHMGYHPELLKHVHDKCVSQKLQKTLEKVHPHALSIMLMKVWENRTHEEIAQELNISVSNSKKILSRSIQHVASIHKDIVQAALYLCMIV